MNKLELYTPIGAPKPIGPYNHICKSGNLIVIGGVAGIDPVTATLAGDSIHIQTQQILKTFRFLLESVDSDLEHIMHINIFLKNMSDFEEMNKSYVEIMGKHLPARTVIGVNELPKPGVLLTMNLMAVTR